MNEATRKKLIRMGLFVLGALPMAWRVPVGKAIWTKVVDRESGRRSDVQTQFQKQDAVGTFRLGYVDCIPYSGPEQVISIDEQGEIQCVDPSYTVPGNIDETKSSPAAEPRKRIGKLNAGTLLKGEIDLAPGVVSIAARGGAKIASLKMQVVYLPGGPPGVWLAVSAQTESNRREVWDEIYVRPGFEPKAGVTA